MRTNGRKGVRYPNAPDHTLVHLEASGEVASDLSSIEGDVTVIFDEIIEMPLPPDLEEKRPERHRPSRRVMIFGLILLVVLALT